MLKKEWYIWILLLLLAFTGTQQEMKRLAVPTVTPIEEETSIEAKKEEESSVEITKEETSIEPKKEETSVEVKKEEESLPGLIEEGKNKEGVYDIALGKEAFALANEIRTAAGAEALLWDEELYETAKIRAEEASIVWSHTRPDGSHWSILSENLHGENLAKGYKTAKEAVDAWMASKGHKENLLRESFTRGAVAFFSTSNGWFWCQHFGY